MLQSVARPVVCGTVLDNLPHTNGVSLHRWMAEHVSQASLMDIHFTRDAQQLAPTPCCWLAAGTLSLCPSTEQESKLAVRRARLAPRRAVNSPQACHALDMTGACSRMATALRACRACSRVPMWSRQVSQALRRPVRCQHSRACLCRRASSVLSLSTCMDSGFGPGALLHKLPVSAARLLLGTALVLTCIFRHKTLQLAAFCWGRPLA